MQGAMAADSAEQFLTGMETNLVEAGIRRAHIRSDSTIVYDRAQRLVMFEVKADFYNVNGVKESVLSAKHAVYNRMTELMEAFGEVQLTSIDGRRLNTPHLRYNKAANAVTGDSSFVATLPDGTLRGIGFRTDPSMKSIDSVKSSRFTARSSVNVPGR
jgi:LPS export ABC transporter protein LptC